MGSRIGFGMQCFWGAEAIFGSLDGVYTTRVGYAGGSTPTPTYKNLADHIETVEVVFDESRLTLNVKLNSHIAIDLILVLLFRIVSFGYLL